MFNQLTDQFGRVVRPIVLNENPLGTGSWHVPIVDSQGRIVFTLAPSDEVAERIKTLTATMEEVLIEISRIRLLLGVAVGVTDSDKIKT